MTIVSVLIFTWMLIGGCIMLYRKIPELKQLKVVKGTVIDWEKRKGNNFLNKYVPVVQYKDSQNEGLQQIVLDKQSSGLFFRPSTDGGLSDMRVIWLVIMKNKEIKPLFHVISDTLLPVGFIVIGLAVILQLIEEIM